MLELYSAAQSTCSQKVRLTLAEKHLEFVEHKMKLFQNDQLKPEYLLNSNGYRADAFRRWCAGYRLIGNHGILGRSLTWKFPLSLD